MCSYLKYQNFIPYATSLKCKKTLAGGNRPFGSLGTKRIVVQHKNIIVTGCVGLNLIGISKLNLLIVGIISVSNNSCHSNINEVYAEQIT